MPIRVSQTYEIVTPESAEAGDVEESGFDFENAEFGLRELVDYIESNGFTEPSYSQGCPDWVTQADGNLDYQTGAEERKSLHPGRDDRSRRYWEKALRAAGVIQ
ncbi:hypothetical protein ACLBVF_10375 [Pseudomonas aeruginosa]|uniref:hypothetical protein n=1 Tax=Pseudomonas aeruginosa TaxID=287 RepID=UPI00156EFAE7|nr:hypothetical protein [Pseudomonas aeruginosa]MBW6354919.1 hypothetical protein [Pseudomonas aeruginosa]MBX6192194.1 hypothetical protein [Pseudomonas aeruginosa]MDC8987009.1 hypothetical protein [Pseudomonas aeruginosa]MED5026681.1 hypothetical protein [Pseudomonas aeruginosa]QKL14524.1 hypothetical protein GEV42_21625 [Pseudomonas aeruginosa]